MRIELTELRTWHLMPAHELNTFFRPLLFTEDQTNETVFSCFIKKVDAGLKQENPSNEAQFEEICCLLPADRSAAFVSGLQ